MDRRTKRQKLRDMANQSVSPNEAEVARRKLEELPEDEPTLPISFTISFGYDEVKPSGETWDFSEPFAATQGEGVFVFDFTKNEWRKVD